MTGTIKDEERMINEKLAMIQGKEDIIEQLGQQITELEITQKGNERERQIYFERLCDLEERLEIITDESIEKQQEIERLEAAKSEIQQKLSLKEDAVNPFTAEHEQLVTVKKERDNQWTAKYEKLLLNLTKRSDQCLSIQEQLDKQTDPLVDQLKMSLDHKLSKLKQIKNQMEQYRSAIISLKNSVQNLPSARISQVDRVKVKSKSNVTMRTQRLHKYREQILKKPKYAALAYRLKKPKYATLSNRIYLIENNPVYKGKKIPQRELRAMEEFLVENEIGNAQPVGQDQLIEI